MQADYVLFVEPVNNEDRDKVIDFNQQMVSRPKEAYDKKFIDFGFKILNDEVFNKDITEEDLIIIGCHAWILKCPKNI